MARLRCAKTACQGRKNGGPPLRHNSVPGKEIAQDFGTAKHRSLNRMPIAGPFTSCFLTATSFLARSPRSGRGRRIFTLIRFAQKITRIGYLFSPEFSRLGRFGWWTTSSLPCCQGFASGDQETWPRFRRFFLPVEGRTVSHGRISKSMFVLFLGFKLSVASDYAVWCVSWSVNGSYLW